MIPKALNVGRMRLRSGIKTPSAEELHKSAAVSNGGTPTPTLKSKPTAAQREKPASAKRDTPTFAKPKPSPVDRGTTSSAKRNSSLRKRKAAPVQENEQESEAETDESEDEMAELDGALSAGEDDGSDDESPRPEDDSEGEPDDAPDEEDEEEDEDDALHSDDEDESSQKIPPLKKGQIPGLDPDGLGDGEDDSRNYRVETDAHGNERYVYEEIDPVYDSDDTDANEPVNTIGNIDLKFYDSYPHIGYDINGKKIMRPAAGEALDALLDSIEVPKGWTGLTDPATGKPLNLSQDELELIKKIQMNELPQDYDPYPVSATPILWLSFEC